MFKTNVSALFDLNPRLKFGFCAYLRESLRGICFYLLLLNIKWYVYNANDLRRYTSELIFVWIDFQVWNITEIICCTYMY